MLAAFKDVFRDVKWQVMAFAMMVLIYGMFGSPTPDRIGLVEGICGGLLVACIGIRGFWHCLHYRISVPSWFYAGQVLLFFGLVIGVIGGVIGGAPMQAMMRDILPFGFMFLPLFFYPYVISDLGEGGMVRNRDQNMLIYAFIGLGLLFGLRALSVDYNALYYLANSPAVLFAALVCFAGMAVALAQAFSLKRMCIFALCLIGFIISVWPLVLSAQRASIAAIVVYAVIIWGVMFMRAPKRVGIVSLAVLLTVALILWPIMADIYSTLQGKTGRVGVLNMRGHEWAAVWEAIAHHPMTVLFGRGWGASFSSPAVADIRVFYTHSLLSGVLLKIGVVGFILTGVYIGAICFAVMRVLRRQPIWALAVLAPVSIDVFLYAAHKSLDFGILLMIGVIVARVAQGGNVPEVYGGDPPLKIER